MEVWVEEDSVRFARSAAVCSRRTALALEEGSFLCLRLNSCRHAIHVRHVRHARARRVNPRYDTSILVHQHQVLGHFRESTGTHLANSMAGHPRKDHHSVEL